MKLFSLIFTLIITCSSVFATTVTIPNSFSSGTATNAAQMNANFTAVKAAVDDNDSRISALEGSSGAGQFMGFSSGTTNGAGGILTMSNYCHASFSGSHVCSTVEFVNSNMNGASNLSGNAWINPSLGGSNGLNDLANGREYCTVNHSSCNGWSMSNASANCGASTVGSGGASISSIGVISATSCNNVIAVACCK
jgi:hypothetical protein